MKNVIKKGIIFLLCFITSVLFIEAKAQQAFDKADFYKVMEKGNLDAVESLMKTVLSEPVINKDAYSGALLLKKAGLIKGPSKKLSVFKEGHKKLEAAIKADAGNVEWHFLRLLIQEHAPKMLGYHEDIKKDAAFVHTHFKKLSPEVQAAVLDYRKQSDTLQPLNF